jgi:hypothetical protein
VDDTAFLLVSADSFTYCPGIEYLIIAEVILSAVYRYYAVVAVVAVVAVNGLLISRDRKKTNKKK